MASPAFLSTFGTSVMILLMSCSQADCEESCRQLNAAFRFDSALFLISGEDYFQVDIDEQKEMGSGKVADRFGATPAEIHAATVWPNDNTLYFFSDKEYYYYSNWFQNTYGPFRNSRWTPFFVNGIDAAGRMGDKSYFFKGCEYVVYDGSYSKALPIHDLGLPCDVDAAWDQGDFLVVVKKGQSWIIDADGGIRGPILLSKEITLNSTTLCESESKDSWSDRLRKELAFEKENECVIIDSAIEYEGTVYLFNDDSYVRLDNEGKESRLAKNYDWGGLGNGVEAAVTVEEKSKSYFFQGDQYYTYYGLAFGPFSSATAWASFFSDGVQAAGQRRGLTYFFQGCRVAQYEVNEGQVSEIHNSEDLGLPCDVDAAYSKGDSLYIIKGNLIWIWGDDVRGPGPLSEVVTLESWNVCSFIE